MTTELQLDAKARAESLQRRAIPLVECHHCKGCGKLPLSVDMLLTLDAVKFLTPATAGEVATAVLWSGHVSAINNRLEDLRRSGLLSRQRDGRRWMYRYNGADQRPGHTGGWIASDVPWPGSLHRSA